MTFLQRFEQQLAAFTPHLNQECTLPHSLFRKKSAPVREFVEELRQTAELLFQTQCDGDQNGYAAIYAEHLFRQFEQLKYACTKLTMRTTPHTYRSPYSFPKNVHNLPPPQRLKEYYRALRALDEKISWATEQLYQAELNANENWIRHYHEILLETEYRKQKCLSAIDELSAEMVKWGKGEVEAY